MISHNLCKSNGSNSIKHDLRITIAGQIISLQESNNTQTNLHTAIKENPNRLQKPIVQLY